MNDKNSPYDTVDLYLSSFLKARGLQLIDVIRPGTDGKVHFLFENSGKTKKLIQQFYDNEDVKVGDFIHCLRDLKSRLFNTS